ncbi:MAG: hypothetical protein FWD01_00700 [Defluviitaleaceae bacterium]|nr:hypothetical protein [Defluviitaleaceae bacterium]
MKRFALILLFAVFSLTLVSCVENDTDVINTTSEFSTNPEDVPYGYPSIHYIQFMSDYLYSRMPFTYRE